MDQRQTFNNTDELLSIISAFSNQSGRVSLLIDNNGLERVEGIITGIKQEQGIDGTCITVDNDLTIRLNDIIGINGLFRADYSEC